MHLYAKKLNNSAASYIEKGQHDQAIGRLKKALYLIQQSGSNDTNHSVTSNTTTTEQVCCCCCNYCCLDECMVYSEENALYVDDGLENEEGVMYDNMGTETTTLPSTQFKCNKEEADGSRCEDYIHRRPIRFAPRFLLDGGHDMGPFLSLPILFNLALAHHLQCILMFNVSPLNSDTTTTTTTTTTKNSAAMKRVALQKVLRLYELTYALQTELISKDQYHQQLHSATTTSVLCTSSTSEGITDPGLRFNIIICNNLSQVHKILQNHEKHKRCLQQLLSMLMYVVDMEHESYNSSSSSSSSSNNNVIHAQEHPQASSLLSSPVPLTTMTTSLPSPHRQRGRKWLLMDLDGFLQNTSPIILQNNCAMVA